MSRLKELLGCKAAALVRLERMKQPVPPFYVITSEAFRLAVDSTGLAERIDHRLEVTYDDGTDSWDERAAEIRELINRWTRRHSPRQTMHRLQAAGIAAAAVNNARDLHRDPQLKARGFFVKGRHPVLGRTQQDASPIRLSRNPARRPRNAPRFGEHNNYVYHHLLGLSEAEIARLVAAQVIH